MQKFIDVKKIKSPLIFKGDEKTAYRDPAIVHDGSIFHIFFTLVKTEGDGVYMYIAKSESRDLIEFTPPKILTEKDKSKNYSSPGNIIKHDGKWTIVFQSYCRENGEKYGNGNCRIFAMESRDLINFSEPEMLYLKGDTAPENMGRMIDPYLIEDKDEKGKWWCFYKQNGASMSYSRDLTNWTYFGNTNSGENVCVVVKNGEYVMYHSPENGIGRMKSKDLISWTREDNLITLGQRGWDWAKGRITAGVFMDITDLQGEPLYLLLFHGSGPENEETMFDNYASLGIAYSYDGEKWLWN